VIEMDLWHRELLLKELRVIISYGGDISRAKMIERILREN